jgi:hypothetical protein
MSLIRTTIRQFEVFALVAELRGFAAAGERLGLSSEPSAAAIPPCAQAVLDCGGGSFETTTTSAPWRAAASAALNPATPHPRTRTSTSRRGKARVSKSTR